MNDQRSIIGLFLDGSFIAPSKIDSNDPTMQEMNRLFSKSKLNFSLNFLQDLNDFDSKIVFF